jgi:L-ascorbate metabolism protein UlaG (beta-lactamase superfamily)
MKRLFATIGFCAILGLLITTVASADDNADAVAITKALEAAKPAVAMTEPRLKALTALDDWIAQVGSDRDAAHIAYYQAAVDRALDKLQNERVASGVRIFQLYASSVVVQTPETTFAFDLDQGPNKDVDKTPDEEDIPFHLTQKQIERLASLVEYSFHTHEHSDHIDFQLTQALLAAGKTVIVTESNKEVMWKKYPWAKKMVVLAQTDKKPVEVGPLKVDVLWDHQWDKAAHASGTPCNAFVVETPGGVTVMTKGDINCGLQLYGWLSLLKKRGVHVDVVVGSALFWKGVDTLVEWDELFSPLWLPGHLWEFEHRDPTEPKGHCASFVDGWQLVRSHNETAKAQVLSWGEWIDIAGR